MKHYKTPNGSIRAVDHDQIHIVCEDWVLMTSKELADYLNPPKTADQILSDCQCALSDKRSFEARSGVVVNGVAMQTDKESIAAMDQYATESMMNGLTVVHWEKADGTFHDWPIADFKKLFSEITKYVNACFGRQSQLLNEINAAEDPEIVDISTGWPSKTITFV